MGWIIIIQCPRTHRYRRRSMNTGSPSTMLVICLDDPVKDISRPPNDAYAVLRIVSLNDGSETKREYSHKFCRALVKTIHLRSNMSIESRQEDMAGRGGARTSTKSADREGDV